jgi:hypothetical protein
MKKLQPEELQKAYAFRITKDEFAKVNRLANYMGLTFTDFVRLSIRKQYNASLKQISKEQMGLFNQFGYDKDINEIIG